MKTGAVTTGQRLSPLSTATEAPAALVLTKLNTSQPHQHGPEHLRRLDLKQALPSTTYTAVSTSKYPPLYLPGWSNK